MQPALFPCILFLLTDDFVTFLRIRPLFRHGEINLRKKRHYLTVIILALSVSGTMDRFLLLWVFLIQTYGRGFEQI